VRLLLPIVALLAFAASAQAGGAPERIIAVGGNGHWASIPLGQNEGDALDALGPSVPRPSTGFVRVYPLIGELPGLPGRFYPSAGTFCWDRPGALGRPGSCHRTGPKTVRVLRSTSRLSPLHATTNVVRMTQCGVDKGLTNVAVGIELAFERGLSRPTRFPVHAFQLEVTWLGPEANQRPRIVFVTPAGIFARGRTYRAPRGVWEFAQANLR
jgi:hypothetical protein